MMKLLLRIIILFLLSVVLVAASVSAVIPIKTLEEKPHYFFTLDKSGKILSNILVKVSLDKEITLDKAQTIVKIKLADSPFLVEQGFVNSEFLLKGLSTVAPQYCKISSGFGINSLDCAETTLCKPSLQFTGDEKCLKVELLPGTDISGTANLNLKLTLDYYQLIHDKDKSKIPELSTYLGGKFFSILQQKAVDKVEYIEYNNPYAVRLTSYSTQVKVYQLTSEELSSQDTSTTKYAVKASALEAQYPVCTFDADGFVEDNTKTKESTICIKNQPVVCKNGGYIKNVNDLFYARCYKDNNGQSHWQECDVDGKKEGSGSIQYLGGAITGDQYQYLCSSQLIGGTPQEVWLTCSDDLNGFKGKAIGGYSCDGKKWSLAIGGGPFAEIKSNIIGDLNNDFDVNKKDLDWIKSHPKDFWEKILKKDISNLNLFVKKMQEKWS